jgi:hypothetical protein
MFNLAKKFELQVLTDPKDDLLIHPKESTEHTDTKGNIFIESTDSKEFSIRCNNLYSFPVDVVLSIDGRSVKTRQPASSKEKGYNFLENQTQHFQGFIKDERDAKHRLITVPFAFHSTYFGQGFVGMDHQNIGVIGVNIFRTLAQHRKSPIVFECDIVRGSTTRGQHLGQIVIRYDTKKGLERRGILINDTILSALPFPLDEQTF